MRLIFAKVVVILTLALPAIALADLRVRPEEWAQPIIGMPLGNFFRVSEELYRSQQPDDEELGALANAGIRSVLNLREFHSDDGSSAPMLKLYEVPMNAGEIEESKLEEAMKILARAPKPILVHCWHGSDRTGVVVALYRMVLQDWPREKAIDEFVNGGFGYHRNVYPNIEKYLETVDIQRLRKLVSLKPEAPKK